MLPSHINVSYNAWYSSENPSLSFPSLYIRILSFKMHKTMIFTNDGILFANCLTISPKFAFSILLIAITSCATKYCVPKRKLRTSKSVPASDARCGESFKISNNCSCASSDGSFVFPLTFFTIYTKIKKGWGYKPYPFINVIALTC